MNLLAYINLIKEFAAADPALKHHEKRNPAVFSVSYEDAVPLLSSITDRMILLVPPYSKNIRHNAAMGSVWLKDGLAMALQYVQPDDQETKLQVFTESEQVLDRLYAFLTKNRNSNKLYGFDPNAWNSDSIGPVGENHYGYFAEFSLKDGISF